MFEHKGVRIDVNDSGRFVATVGDAELHDVTLDGVKEKIDKEIAAAAKKESVSLPVVGVLKDGTWTWETNAIIGRGTVTGINRTSGTLQIAGTLPKGFDWYMVFVDSPENEEFAKAYIATAKEFKALTNKASTRNLARSSGRIGVEDYPAVLQRLRDDYAARSKKK